MERFFLLCGHLTHSLVDEVVAGSFTSLKKGGDSWSIMTVREKTYCFAKRNTRKMQVCGQEKHALRIPIHEVGAVSVQV